MNKIELERRTMQFALRIIAFVATLPKGKIGDVVGYQLVKAGTSVGANYREANRAESRNDFIHKIGIVEKEASESRYWLEICDGANLGEITERRWLLQEAGELLAIFTSIGRTTKRSRQPVAGNYKSAIRNPKCEIL
jgi:four helix bundle protein